MSEPQPPRPDAARDGLADLVEHLFRRSAGKMVSALTRVLGPGNLDVAEGVVQDALVKALQTWPYTGVPDNPEGWLFRVARNRALDRLRSQETRRRHHDALADAGDAGPMGRATGAGLSLEPLADDELAMIFMCCHPGIPPESRLALTLKTVGGFSTDEIASAFLAKRSAIQQRVVRAKRRIREDGLRFEVPPSEALGERLGSVLTVLYLMFNEGYNASHGDALVRRDLCQEAIRLVHLLLERHETALPEVHALMALMLLQASRLAARSPTSGALILLEDQDRDAWDRAMIARGLHHLDLAATGDRLSPIHLEAGIAAEHATAASWKDTDWRRILEYYDQLEALASSPVVALNRAVALTMVDGAKAGLDALKELATPLADYYLLHAVRAELFVRAGLREQALDEYGRALELAEARPERRWLLERRARCAGDETPPRQDEPG